MNKEKTQGLKVKKLTVQQCMDDAKTTGAISGEMYQQIRQYMNDHPQETNDFEKMFKSHLYPNKAITWVKLGLSTYEDFDNLELATLVRLSRIISESGYVAVNNQQLQTMTGLSKNTITKVLKGLKQKGAIKSIGATRDGLTIYEVNPNIIQRGKDRDNSEDWIRYTETETWKRGIRNEIIEIADKEEENIIKRVGTLNYVTKEEKTRTEE